MDFLLPIQYKIFYYFLFYNYHILFFFFVIDQSKVYDIIDTDVDFIIQQLNITHEIINEITQKTLTVKLKELEEKNIINREVYAEVPPKVVYSLTDCGKRLKPVLQEMYKWGITYVDEFGKNDNIDACQAEFCLKS